MGRVKGAKNKVPASSEGIVTAQINVPTPIALLPVDFSSEQLNDMAKKINEIIARL